MTVYIIRDRGECSMKKIIPVFMIMLGLFALAGCNQAEQTEVSTEELKQMVQDFTDRTLTAKSASITSTQLVVVDDDDKEKIYDLPEDEFFVSIAPFMTYTHPCGNHSLTGCQGELVHSEFDVRIEDEKGNVVLDDKVKTGENGFFDLWLPNNQKYMITVNYEDKTVQSELSTFEEDGTCITTLQLI